MRMRKVLYLIIAVLGIVLLVSHFAEIRGVADVLLRANPAIMLFALLLQLCWLGVIGYTYHRLYAAVRIETRPLAMTQLTTAGIFINVVAPAGGMSSMALFLSNARNKGLSAARVTVASVLFILGEYTVTLLFVLISLALLAARRSLHWPESLSALVLALATSGLILLVLLGARSATLLGATLSRIVRPLNRFSRTLLRREVINPAKPHQFARELAEGLHLLRLRPLSLLEPFSLTVLNKLMLVMVLGYCFYAFDLPLTWETVFCGFSISHLFVIVSPTPAGLGVVEGVMTMVLRSLGIPVEQAAVLTLAYRGVTFWFPFIVGMISLRSLTLPRPSLSGALFRWNHVWKRILTSQ